MENDNNGEVANNSALTFVVRSEDEAFGLLKQALESELVDRPYVLEFENWPILTMRFVGAGYNRTITPQIAEALVGLQHAMNRSFARLVRNAASSNVLTKEDRKSIDFKATVDEGSSLITVDFGAYAQALATALVGKMTGTELVVTILGIVISGGGFLAYKAYLAARSQDKQVDQATKQLVEMSAQETRRLEVFAQALATRPALRDSHEDFESARHDLLKSVGDASQLNIQGIQLSQEQARVIALTPRTKPEEVQLNGTYRIVKLDWSKDEEVRISVFGVDAVRREFTASMRAHNLTPQNIEKLKSCEWERKAVYLSVNATILRGVVTHAVIVGVEWPRDGDSTPSVPTVT